MDAISVNHINQSSKNHSLNGIHVSNENFRFHASHSYLSMHIKSEMHICIFYFSHIVEIKNTLFMTDQKISQRWSCCFLSGKNRRRSSIFDSCWKNDISIFVSIFSCALANLVHFLHRIVADVDVNNKNSKSEIQRDPLRL